MPFPDAETKGDCSNAAAATACEYEVRKSYAWLPPLVNSTWNASWNRWLFAVAGTPASRIRCGTDMFSRYFELFGFRMPLIQLQSPSGTGELLFEHWVKSTDVPVFDACARPTAPVRA